MIKLNTPMLGMPYLAAALAIIFGLASPVQADSNICYAFADAGNQLVQMDRTPVPNANNSVVGNPAGVSDIEAIALYLDGTTLYAADEDTLGTLNTVSGLFTPVAGTFGSGDGADGNQDFDDVDGLAFDSTTGVFYGTHRRGDDHDLLFQIDRATGLFEPDAFGPGVDYVVIATNIIGTGIIDVDDIAIHPVTGQMYGVANDGGTEDHLIEISKVNGTIADVGIFHRTLVVVGNEVDDIEALSFYNDGTLYAVTGQNSTTANSDRNRFYTVNPATAEMVDIMLLPAGGLSDYEGVACLSGGTILGVSKTSSINGGALGAGDSIDYTITITNNGTADATNIVVDDPLPANTAYTVQSTLVNGFAQLTGVLGDFEDVFNDNPRTYSQNNGSLDFPASWVENDEDGGQDPAGGNMRIDDPNSSSCPNASRCLRVQSEELGEYLYRALNLSVYNVATLTFDYEDGLDAGEIVVEASSDGITYGTLKTYTGAVNSGTESFDISTYISANTHIRFRVTVEQNNFYLGIDNFQVSVEGDAGSTTALIKDNIPAGANADLDDGVPADLVTANDDFALQPGQSMSVTFTVETDSPLTSLPNAIDNTVNVTSDQTPDPVSDTVSDPVGRDHGDIPLSYGDAEHIRSGNLYLGSVLPDLEPASQGVDATGDDTDGLDDEDSVVEFSSPAGGTGSIEAEITVTNSTGGNVTVCAWLDRDADGGFLQAGDGICQIVADGASPLPFTWSNLPNDQQYDTFVRFRITSGTLTTSTPAGDAPDGEIEDYAISYYFDPTAVTIGAIGLESVQPADFLSGLGVEQMSADELLALLAKWDADLAAQLSYSDHQSIVDALTGYLDPDADGQLAVLRWDTLEERGTVGFYVERRQFNNQSEGPWAQINDEMLPGLITAPMGGEYQLADPSARAGEIYQYRLIEQEARGTTRTYGPFNLEMGQ